MEIQKLLHEYISFEKALEAIKENKSRSYKWYPVLTDAGCLIEFGGRNEGNILELKADIPKIENDRILCHSNGFVNYEWSIEFSNKYLYTALISFPCKYIETNIKSMEEFINFVNNDKKINFIRFGEYFDYKQYISLI